MSSNRNLKIYAAMSAAFLAVSPNAIGTVLAAGVGPFTHNVVVSSGAVTFDMTPPDTDTEFRIFNTFGASFAANTFQGDTDGGPHSFVSVATATGGGGGYAAMLNQSDAIAMHPNWGNTLPVNMCTTSSPGSFSSGPWLPTGATGYIGIRITQDGGANVHHGWIEIETNASRTCGPITVLRTYYNDSPISVDGSPLQAGTTPTAVSLSEFSATEAETSPWQIATLSAALMTAMTGLFAWFRRKQSA